MELANNSPFFRSLNFDPSGSSESDPPHQVLPPISPQNKSHHSSSLTRSSWGRRSGDE